MTRLIDADALREDWLQNGENEYVYDANAFIQSIDDAPTMDAVEVVHCGDCAWYEPDSKVCTKFEHDELFDEDCGCNHGKPRMVSDYDNTERCV